MIETYTADKNDVKLTIGVLKSDKINYQLFGAPSKELEPVEYEYEIGSISKIFTTSMLCKAIAAMTIVMFLKCWSSIRVNKNILSKKSFPNLSVFSTFENILFITPSCTKQGFLGVFYD